MPAGRFVVAKIALIAGAEIELPSAIAHQARDVLRLAPGAVIHLLDGVGGVYPAEIVSVDRKRVVARLGQPEEVANVEPSVRIVLCQGMLKAAKFEVVLQKCAELGVAEFVPLVTERAVAASQEMSAPKQARWRAILAQAIEQCGGARLPFLSAPRSLSAALADMPPSGLALFPWEEARDVSLRAAVLAASAPPGGFTEARLFIGPEGGFSPAEADLATRAGAILVTLGPRILRAETAAIVATTLTLDALGLLL